MYPNRFVISVQQKLKEKLVNGNAGVHCKMCSWEHITNSIDFQLSLTWTGETTKLLGALS